MKVNQVILIAYLRGKLALKTPTHVYVDCNGVAYHVNISLNTYSKLESLTDVQLFTYMHTNDDGSTLYGFMDETEKEMFVLLISVSGVGPNTARVLLSGMTVDEAKSAIMHENVAALNKVKGIGPKTAKRIILDLKDKVFKLSGDAPLEVSTPNSTLRDEATSALVALGFPKNAVIKQIDSAMKKNPEINQVEAVIKTVLKQMR